MSPEPSPSGLARRLGTGACAVLVVTLPVETVLTGVAVFAVGVGYRL